jgi:hypothetical protein
MPILFQQRRRLTNMLSLIVSMTILLNLFAPALSQAVTLRGDSALVLEICSATPLVTATSTGGSQHAPNGHAGHALKHCMLCAAHAGGDAPPPVAAGLLTVLAGHDVYPAARPATQWRHIRWSEAQPRGPPALA